MPNQAQVVPDNKVVEVKVQNGYTDVPNKSESLLPILAVKVRLGNSDKSITNQAFLDPKSTGSFITMGLMEKLQIIQRPTIDVTISTLNQIEKKSKSTMVSNLQISDYEESDFLYLQPLLSIN